LFHSWEKKY